MEITIPHQYQPKSYQLEYLRAPQRFKICVWHRRAGKSKTALNGYVAHCPQSLNAMTLNKAYLKVFYEIALPNPNDFKLMAQIHDSIFFQYRIGRDDLALRVKELMEIPTECTDIRGITRTFTVPAALKSGGEYWSQLE